MRLRRDDRVFALGLAGAGIVLVAYQLGLRRPLEGELAQCRERVRALQSELAAQAPRGGRPAAEVEEELAEFQRAAADRLGELRRAVEFDPESVLDPLDAVPTEGPEGYLVLSRRLHSKLRAVVEQQPEPARVPSVFDPQGEVRMPSHPGQVPQLRRQLTMGYAILRAALAARVDVLELRTVPSTGIEEASGGVVDSVAATVKTRGSLDSLAAFLHALSTPGAAARSDEGLLTVGARPCRTLCVRRLHLAPVAEEDGGRLEAQITLAALRVRAHVVLVPAEPQGGKDEPGTGG